MVQGLCHFVGTHWVSRAVSDVLDKIQIFFWDRNLEFLQDTPNVVFETL